MPKICFPCLGPPFIFLLSLLPLIKFRPLYSYYVPPRLAFLLSALARIILCNISASTRIAWLGPVGFFNFAHVIAIIITISLPFWPFICKVSMPGLRTCLNLSRYNNMCLIICSVLPLLIHDSSL